MQWGATANRTINWVGIGATNGGECVPDIHGFVSGTFVRCLFSRAAPTKARRRVDGPSPALLTPAAILSPPPRTSGHSTFSLYEIMADTYLRRALYDTACQADFAITTNATYQSISFNIFVDYTDCSYVTRDVRSAAALPSVSIPTRIQSNNITECNDVTTNLPVTILFPLTTTVSTSATAVFSASSVQRTSCFVSSLADSIAQ